MSHREQLQPVTEGRWWVNTPARLTLETGTFCLVSQTPQGRQVPAARSGNFLEKSLLALSLPFFISLPCHPKQHFLGALPELTTCMQLFVSGVIFG